MSEDHHGLRRVEGHNRHAAGQQDLGFVRQRRTNLRQASKQRIEQLAKFLGRDVTRSPDIYAIPGNHVLVSRHDVFPRQRRNAFYRAIDRRRVGVVSECEGIESPRCYRVRIRVIAANDRQHLVTHAIQCNLIEPRGRERALQKRDGLVPVFGQEPCRNRECIAVNIESVACGKGVPRCGKSLSIKVSRALLQDRSHQVDRPPLAGPIERTAATEPDFQGGERN